MKAKVAQRGAAPVRAGPAPAARGRSSDIARAVQLARTAPASLDRASLLTLQAHSGNAAVAELLGGATVIDLRRHPRFGETRDAGGGCGPGVVVQLQPATACPPPPVAAPPVEPHDDPGFQAVKGRVGSAAAQTKDHPPAKAKAKEAQAAAAGPSNEAASKAGAAHIDDMAEQKPGTFDKEAFIAAVHKAVDEATPKKMDDVEQFKKSGKAGEIKAKVAGQVTGTKDAAAKDIRGAAEAPADPSKAKTTSPVPMQEEHPGSPPGDVGAQQAMPPPKKPEEVDLGHTACATDCRMAEAGITKEQVDKSNEPQFHQALDAKQKADDQAAKAPDQFRQQEQAKLEQAKGGAAVGAHAHLAGMHGAKVAALAGVSTHKGDTKAADEKEKADLARDLDATFNETKGEVTKILADLDKTVADTFDSGEKNAKAAFENHVEQKRSERYSGIAGAALWLKEKVFKPPPEVNNFITEGRDLYVKEMDGVISRIADSVARELAHAKEVIATGRQKVKERIAKLSPRLREEGEKAAAGMEEKFGQLDQDVANKQESIVSDLAQKYVAARDAVDEEANQMREANKSLTDAAIGEVEEMAQTILKVKDMLLGVLAKAGNVIETIVNDPIAFLGNLIGAVKQGLGQFVSNIGKHLQAGLMGWLLGELADAGITMPDKFDLKGILHLVAQVLGFTWDHIKELARKVLGDPIMAMIEKGSEVVQKVMGIFETLKNEGIAGLWHMIVDKISDLKDAVIGQIKDFVITKVIVAGVTWLVSLLNPASAFVKACKAIYDVVIFFVERGKEIVELVNTILDNLGAIASGALGAAANLVETVLAKILPVAISFLASLLGVGGLSTKIKEIIEAVRKPVDKALTWVLTTVVKPVAKLAMKGLKWIGGKIKAGAAWVKGKAKAGMEKLKSKFGKKVDSKRPEAKQRRLDQALDLAGRAVGKFAGRAVGSKILSPVLTGIKLRYRLTRLAAVEDGDRWAIEGELNPTGKRQTGAKVSKVDAQKVRAATDAAKAELAKASAEYRTVHAKNPDATFACGGGEIRQQGGGSFEAAQRDPGAARRWLEADAARWADLGAVAQNHLFNMLELTDEAQKRLRRLRKQESIDELRQQMRSYRYPTALKARVEHFERTGEYLPRRSPKDRGRPGSTSVVHAEKLLRNITQARAIGVSRNQCGDCQLWFRAQAKSANDFMVVADPSMVRVYMPDGSVKSPKDVM